MPFCDLTRSWDTNQNWISPRNVREISSSVYCTTRQGQLYLFQKIPFQLSDLLRFAMGGKRLDFPLFLNYIRSALLKSYLTFSWSLCKYEKGKYQRIFGRSMHLLLPFPLFESLNGFSNFIHFGSLSAWLLWQSSISQITHTDFTKTISKHIHICTEILTEREQKEKS